jgi:hypothetical protein
MPTRVPIPRHLDQFPGEGWQSIGRPHAVIAHLPQNQPLESSLQAATATFRNSEIIPLPILRTTPKAACDLARISGFEEFQFPRNRKRCRGLTENSGIKSLSVPQRGTLKRGLQHKL